MAKNLRWYSRGSVDPVRSGERFRAGCCSSQSLAGWRPPPFLMPRGGLLFWVLVSILLSVALAVVLNLLLLF